MSGIGNIFGMFCGGINLPKVVPWLGGTQFKVLCAIASISMAVTVGISVAAVPERDARLEPKHSGDQGLVALFKSLWKSVFRLPTQIKNVCLVQFMAWIGWFPFLFYTTTYIGEIYVEPFFDENPHMSPEEVNELWDRGTRRGAVALLAFAVVTFVSSIILPFFVVPAFQPRVLNQVAPTLLTPSASHTSVSGYFNFKPGRNKVATHIHHLQDATTQLLSSMEIKGLTMKRIWLYSHLMFAACMASTFVVRNVTMATILVGLIGVPWSVACWSPFALISSEISKREAMRRGIIKAPSTEDGELIAAGEDDSADQAGVVLGIHNVAISAPQVLATLLSSLIFKFTQKPRGTPGDESVAWCFRLGGVCALFAAYFTLRITEDTPVLDNGRPDEDL
jgi:solute carrier family 45 protein 1/2/4